MSRFELAERVIELRERANLTQGEAAQKAGVGVTTWSNIETGTITRPHARTVIKMARALGVEPEELSEPARPKAPELPLDIESIEAEVLRTTKPETRAELKDAILETGARELLAHYRPEDLYELRKTLREERQRIHEQPRTRAEIDREDPLSVLVDLLWNIEAVERALESALGPQLAGPPEEEIN